MPGDENIVTPQSPSTIINKSSIKSIEIVRVIHDFEGDKSTMLDLTLNDTVYVLAKGNNGWWDGIIETGGEFIRGWFPASYTKSITQTPNFTKILKQSLSDSSIGNLQSSYPSSRRNSGGSVESSINEQDRVSVGDMSESQNQINILSVEEVNALCDRILSQTNEPPIWVPQLTDDGVLIYYNEKFNAYSRELPLTATPTLDADSLLSFPKKSALNRLDNVSIPKDDEGLEKLNYRPTNVGSKSNTSIETDQHQQQQQQQQQQQHSMQNQASISKYRQDSVKSLHNYSFSAETVHPWNNALFSDDELFYVDPTDMRTWGQLYKTFVFLLDLSLDALSKNQASIFSTHYNNVTKLCTLFQLSARLVQHELVSQNLDYSIQSKLKKMTNSVAQLGINGDLHLSVQTGLELPYDDGQSASSETLSIDDSYLDKARSDVKLLKMRAESCFKIFSQIRYDDPNHDPTVLPQIYPRFLKDVFDGGNWTNPLFAVKESPFKVNKNEQQQFTGKRPRYYQDKSQRPKILLDKDAISTLEGKKAKLTRILGDLINTLDTEIPEGVDIAKFRDERNVTVLTVVYNILQPASRILDILEAFDFSVFKAVKQIPLFKDSTTEPKLETTNDEASQLESAFFEKEVVSYTYPMLIEFFEFKQELYDSFSELIMDAQGLTLDDPEVFKGIKEDDLINYNKATSQLPTEQLAAKLKLLLIENDINNDNDSRLKFKKDDKLRASIDKLGKSLGMILYSVQQLINERESILNYSSRNMNIEFDISIFMGERHSTMPDLLDEYRNDEISRPRRMSKDVPWYLDIDDAEYSIIYDSKGNIKGGSIDGLISHLTSNGEKDTDFINAFLLTFRSFLSPRELVSKLEARYSIAPPEGLSFEEYNTWIEKKLKVVRINIMTVVWLLLTRYWNYFYYDEFLMKQISSFIERSSEQVVPNKQEYYEKIKQITEICKRRTPNSVGSSYKMETIQNTAPPPPPIVKSSSLRRIKLKDIDPLEMARQLTIREFAFYSRITELEFLDKIWGNKYSHMGSSTNIKFFISYANKLTNFVSFMIIKHKDLKKRADVMVYFIKVCEKCLLLKNYSSLTAIISALSSSPIARLKKTWAQVPKTFTETYNRLDKLMSIDRNYNEYRDLLKFVKENEPCIPFLGIYLTDLTFVSQAISDFINRDRSIINFYKRYKIYYTINESLKYERVPYNFQIVHEIQSFLDNWFTVSPDVNDQHKISLSLEPRIVPNVK